MKLEVHIEAFYKSVEFAQANLAVKDLALYNPITKQLGLSAVGLYNKAKNFRKFTAPELRVILHVLRAKELLKGLDGFIRFQQNLPLLLTKIPVTPATVAIYSGIGETDYYRRLKGPKPFSIEEMREIFTALIRIHQELDQFLTLQAQKPVYGKACSERFEGLPIVPKALVVYSGIPYYTYSRLQHQNRWDEQRVVPFNQAIRQIAQELLAFIDDPEVFVPAHSFKITAARIGEADD